MSADPIRAMLAAAALLIPVASAQTATSAPAPQAHEHEQLRERWRESLDLDLPAEVLERGLPAVTGAGALARDGEAIALVCRALALTGQETRAREIVDAASVDPTSQAWIAVARARLALLDDDLARAVGLLARPASAGAGDILARVRHPENAESWLLLGRALTRAGASGDAEPVLTRFVEIAPLDAEAPAAWHMLAQAALARGAVDASVGLRARAEQSAQWQAFYRARRLQIRESPKEPLPRLGLAQLWLAVGEHTRAQRVLEELVALAPQFCRGWDLLGEASRKRGDTRAARQAYDRALGCDPALPEALFDRGLLAMLERRWPDARVDLERLVDGPAAAEPRFLRAHLELARALVQLGENAPAARRFAHYRELGGTDPLE